jgi:hypothetical protein
MTLLERLQANRIKRQTRILDTQVTPELQSELADYAGGETAVVIAHIQEFTSVAQAIIARGYESDQTLTNLLNGLAAGFVLTFQSVQS